MEHLHSVYHFPNVNSLNPCAWCPANSVNWLWNDFRPDADCFARTFSANRWRRFWHGRIHILFTLPGVSILTAQIDLMHVKHLGSDKYMYGSVLYLLCNHIMSLPSPLENLKQIAREIRTYYRLNHTQVRYRYMNRLSMFTPKNGFPCLRGRAAEVKHFGKALEATWRRHMTEGREIHDKIALMLQMNNQLETILDRHKGNFKVLDLMPQY